MKRLPYDIHGSFHTWDNRFHVELQTWNPSEYNKEGQIFRQQIIIDPKKPKNLLLAEMLRNLADSVETRWEEVGVKD